MQFNEDNEYYIVKGWFENSNGIHKNTFYGAVATPDNYLHPRRVILHGDDAKVASAKAAAQPAKVYCHELMEHIEVGLTPKEKKDNESLMLDDGDTIFRYTCRACGHIQGERPVENNEKCDCGVVPCEECGGQSCGGIYKTAVNEMTGTGAIAIATSPMMTINTSRSGMSDRGGHGHIKNQGPKKVRVGKNRIGNCGLKGIGGKTAIGTISQSGGRRGGRG